MSTHIHSPLKEQAEINASIVFIADNTGAFVNRQPEWEAYTGQKWEEYSGWGWENALPPEERERVKKIWAHSMKTGDVYHVRTRLWSAAHQEYRTIAERAVQIHNDDGTSKQWVGVITDIHDAQKAKRELQKSRQRIDQLFDQVIFGVSQVDLEGRFVLANKRFCEIVGRPLEELLTLKMQEITHPDDRVRNETFFNRSFQDGKGYEIQKRYVRPDGSIVWVRNYVTVLVDEEGRPQYSAALVQDITARRAAEEQRALLILRERAAREEAEQANRAKDEFLATLSHELRTPLTPVLMTASVLESDPSLPASVREEISIIRRNVELEARLIDDLLDLTRITRSKLVLVSSVVDMHRLLMETMEIVGGEAQGAGVALIFDLAARDFYVEGDAARLRQVVWNLLKNAIKFTPEGGRITIRTSTPTAGKFRLTIKDTGVGIVPEALQKIFNAFEQGAAERRFGGLGLGLAVSKAVVDLHGGKIWAESEGVGKGASFIVELATAEAKTQEHPPPKSSPAALPGRMRLLIVEDHTPTLSVMKRLLVRKGFEVAAVSTMADALEEAAKNHFDLVISDIGLPDGSGFDLMRELSRRYDLKGIALSGFGMEEDMAKARAAGFQDHLVKPVNVEQLLQAIENARTPRHEPQ